MAKRTRKLTVICNGGIDESSDPNLLSPNKLRIGRNIVFSLDNTWKKAPGITQWSESGLDYTVSNDKPRYGFDFWRTDIAGNRVSRFVHYAGSQIFSGDKDTGIFTDVTGASVLQQNDVATHDIMGGYAVMCFKNATPKYWNMTGNFADLVGAPNGSIFRRHSTLNVPGGFGFITGLDADPNVLYHSVPGDVTDWAGAGSGTLAIATGDNDPVGNTALFPGYYGGMVISKWRSLYNLRYDFNYADFVVEELVHGIGCISHNGVVAVHNDIIFPSEKGIHSLRTTDKYGSLESTFLSFPIHKTYRKRVDFDRADEMSAVYDDDLNSYLLSYPRIGDGGVISNIMAFNLQTGKWALWDNCPISYFAKYANAKKKTRFAACNNTNLIGTIDESTNLRFGEKINLFCQTGVIYPNGLGADSGFKRLTVFYKPQGDSDLDIFYRIDNDESKELTYSQEGLEGDELGVDFIMGVSRLGRLGDMKRKTIDLEGYGSGIELTFRQNPSDDNKDQGCDVLGYVIEYIPAGDGEVEIVQ